MATNHVSNSNGYTQNSNNVVQALMTDLYQVTMAYAYWQNDRTNDRACFDLFFRKNPFGGEFTLYAGLSECLKFLQNFKFSESDIVYLRSVVLPPDTQDGFFDHLSQMDCSDIQLYSIDEGMVVFPRVPLMRLEGPLGVLQLIETPLLNLINYASLVATNAARFRMAAGPNKSLLEFGLRRAQGPDGGLTASKYSYLGGFDGTSNVLAGKMFGIPLKGTNAHSMVMSYAGMGDLKCTTLQPAEGHIPVEFASVCERWLSRVCKLCGVLKEQTNNGELAAFIAYARSFPRGFLALVDTYDVMKSGVVNFCAVALALAELGYSPIGIRIDSGDLAYQSIVAREVFTKLGEDLQKPWFPKLVIVASNDINEDTLLSLNQQGHSIDSFGIGTHLVTCQKQPALGCVYKLVQVNDLPRIKLSHDIEKVTIPGRKQIYRLYGQDGKPLIDLMQQLDEEPPEQGKCVLCRHPFEESKRAYVRPAKVVPLHKLYWKNGKVCLSIPSLEETRELANQSLQRLREDHKRALNPTPYKVSVSDNLYQFLHELWLDSAPIEELH